MTPNEHRRNPLVVLLQRLLHRLGKERQPASEKSPEARGSRTEELWRVWVVSERRVREMHFFPRSEPALDLAGRLRKLYGPGAHVYLQFGAEEPIRWRTASEAKPEGVVDESVLES